MKKLLIVLIFLTGVTVFGQFRNTPMPKVPTAEEQIAFKTFTSRFYGGAEVVVLYGNDSLSKYVIRQAKKSEKNYLKAIHFIYINIEEDEHLRSAFGKPLHIYPTIIFFYDRQPLTERKAIKSQHLNYLIESFYKIKRKGV